MATEVEALDGPFEGPTDIDQNFDILIEGQNDKIATEQITLQEEQKRLDNPNLKLATIEAVLDDKMRHIEAAKTKKKAIEATLAELPVPGQEKVEVRSYSDPQKKVDQIAEVIKDNDVHLHAQFASIQAILGKHTNSSNPWIQAHQALGLIEDSSRQLIKAEEKRQKHLKELWKEGMDDKAHLYPEMAYDQKWWQNASIVGMIASTIVPMLGQGLNRETAELIHPLVSKMMTIDVTSLADQISSLSKRVPDLMNNMGSQAIQVGSNTSSLQKKDRETLHDWETQQERQDLETQQQLVQEARQNDNSLKERHLEVIKTLTAQIVGH